MVEFWEYLDRREVRERTVKDTAAGELTPYPFPQLANGAGPNRTRAQWKFTKVYITIADAMVNTSEINTRMVDLDDCSNKPIRRN